jgi:2-iminobutanoate/2-iminopropanoate deaminase
MGVERNPSPYGPGFSDTVTVSGPGRWIFVSGQVGADENANIVQGGFRAEADQCFNRIRQSLEAAGATMDDVVQITGFITDINALYPDYAAARAAAFPGSVPASATVEVPALSLGARIEIQTMAFVAQ